MSTQSRLGVGAATVMLLGAVLGPGLLSLPGLAAHAAGPASVIAWLLLLFLSVPVAATFAALGGAYPGGGGVAHFAAIAFGPRLAVAVGWWFFVAVPVGVMAAGLMGGRYVAAALGAGSATAQTVAIVILAVAIVINRAGLLAASRVQTIMVAVLVTLLAATITLSMHRVVAGSFTPFAPHGPHGVANAVNVLFFAFSGWEATTHLSGDLANPQRDLRRATTRTLGVVMTVYVGLVVATIGALGYRAGTEPAPLLTLLQLALGSTGTSVAALAAVLLTLGAVNTYLASGARLGAALAGSRGAVPRSLGHLAIGCCGLLPLVLLDWLSLDVLVRITSALLASVAALGTASGIRLLRGRGRVLAVAATAFLAVVLACCGAYLLAPFLVAVTALLAPGLRKHLPEMPGAFGTASRLRGPDWSPRP